MDGGGDEKGRGAHKISEGEFAGWWRHGGRDAFESLIGPFHSRRDETGAVRCAFRADGRHMNGMGAMHGGCMLSFADFALFSISQKARGGGPAVTVNLNGDFLGPAYIGDWIEATGEVTRAGKSLVFVRGLLTAQGRAMLSFSGVIKIMKGRADAGAG